MTWRWNYAVCFTSTIPSFCRIKLIVPGLPFRGIEVNLVVSASFLDSNRYGSAPFALILDFPLIISISVKQCSTVGAIHRYRCPIIICHAHHLIKFLDTFVEKVSARKRCPQHITIYIHKPFCLVEYAVLHQAKLLA